MLCILMRSHDTQFAAMFNLSHFVMTKEKGAVVKNGKD
jgi:hypothetical protein